MFLSSAHTPGIYSARYVQCKYDDTDGVEIPRTVSAVTETLLRCDVVSSTTTGL